MIARAFTLDAITSVLERSAGRYHEFLRVPDLSAGVYRLAAGAADPQHPHTEDELYYVLSGRATLKVDAEDIPVGPGSIIYVPARAPHRFHSITEALQVLVVFGPAESSRAPRGVEC